ncbi:hypothetical protein ACIBSW_36450 [Actinoplanes sp. NPDC049668]|uniref:hypothetical protein n=1 Tax=unclassified Actinoplanes TaxID=2626549 RepID=UPI0033AE5E1D
MRYGDGGVAPPARASQEQVRQAAATFRQGIEARQVARQVSTVSIKSVYGCGAVAEWALAFEAQVQKPGRQAGNGRSTVGLSA